MYTYNAKVIRIVDGDTVEAEIDLGFSIKITEKVRIENLNTPEIFKPKDPVEKRDGLIAKEKTRQILENKKVTIRTQKRDKYGRVLATIQLSDGQDFTTML